MNPAPYLSACGIVSALGTGKREVVDNLLAGSTKGMVMEDFGLMTQPQVPVARVPLEGIEATVIREFRNSRSNRLLMLAAQEIEDDVRSAVSQYGAERVALVLGCTTSGIEEGLSALEIRQESGNFPKDYSFAIQEIGHGAEYLAKHFGLSSIAISVATACSSSARCFGIGQELLANNLCDAVVLGGVDSLSRLTVHGFHSLGILSPTRCNPFSKNRNGIALGEGAVLFLMSLNKSAHKSDDQSEIRLVGWGDSSDAYHMTAPHPEGIGARLCIQEAMRKAGLEPTDIAYINLHGTGSLQNDLVEALVISETLGSSIPVSSTKAMTGHTLGAAGAIEAALCWLLLSPWNRQGRLPPHVWDGAIDETIAPVALTNGEQKLAAGKPHRIMSNSFAFGGSNSCLILEGP